MAKNKKTKATAPTMSPMQAYITERLRQIDMVNNLDKKSQSRKALAGFVNNATETAVYDKHIIRYNDEEVKEIAAKFKRLFCSLRAISFLYGKYACTLRDQANGLCNMGVYLRRIIDAFKQVDAKIIDSDIAINRMWRECVNVEGISGEEMDLNNDRVLQGVLEVAMNCDENGNELPEETILVRMTKAQYDTFCIGNPYFQSLDTYGGQWKQLSK